MLLLSCSFLVFDMSMMAQNANTSQKSEKCLSYRTKLRELILRIKPEADIDDFPPDAHVKNDLGLNSIEIMELIESIEGVFGVEVDDRSVRYLQQVDQIIGMLDA